MYKMRRYEYSLIVPCLCDDFWCCTAIYNEDSNYYLDGFIEVRLFSTDFGIVKRNVIHCYSCRHEDDVLQVFPDLMYLAAQHVDLLD
jgi:hypothetical protein